MEAHKIELLILKESITDAAFEELFNRIGDLVNKYVDEDEYFLHGVSASEPKDAF